MGTMKMLFLSYCYPPQKYPRSIQISHLVQSLRKYFEIKVITSLSEMPGDESLLSFTPLDNVVYAKKSMITRFIEKSRGHCLKKAILPDLHYFWHFDLYKKACDEIEKNAVDIVVTFGQPMSTHIAGLKLKKKFSNIKWIAHLSDPWVDNMFNDYNPWTRFVNQYYQNRVFKEADLLIFTSEETVNLVMQPYPRSIFSKTRCLPHCFNEVLYEPRKNNNDTFTIRYLGNFYGERQPHFLFEALRRLQENKIFDESFKIELIGASSGLIENMINVNSLKDRVSICGPVNYIESLKLMSESDLLLIIDAPGDVSPFLPSKLVDYIGANKPIFGITPKGTSQRLIESMGFFVANPNNPQEILDMLLLIITKTKSSQLAIAPHLRNRYSVNVVAQQWAAEMKALK